MKHTGKKILAIVLLAMLLIAAMGMTVSAADDGAAADGNDWTSRIQYTLQPENVRNFFKTQLTDAYKIGPAMQKVYDFFYLYSPYMWIAIGVFALIECFFGWKLLRLELVLCGLVGGFTGGLWVFEKMLKVFSMPQYAELIVAGVLAVAAAILAYLLFRVCVFFGAGYGGYVLALRFIPLSGTAAVLAGIGVGIVCAFLSLLLLKLLVSLVTGIFGGVFASMKLFTKVSFMQTVIPGTAALAGYTERIGIPDVTYAVVLGLVVGLVGFIVQMLNTRRRRRI